MAPVLYVVIGCERGNRTKVCWYRGSSKLLPVRIKSEKLMSLNKCALFRCKKFFDFDTVAFSFLFDKHCLIIE